MARLDPTGVSRILSYIKTWVTTALSGKANSSHSHSDYVTVSTNQTITGVKTFNYPAITTKGLRIHSGVGDHGSNGYVKIMTLTITDNYANSCINISFIRRRDNYPSNLYIRFDNAGDADPTLGYFASDYITDCALVKSSTSNWDLYIQKTEAYDRVCITYIHIPEYMDGRITITYKDELASTLPSGYIAASKYAEYLPTSGGAVMGGATKIKIAKSDNNGELRLDGGTDWGQGGSICCHGANDPLDTGSFVLNASDGTNSRMLMGFPNGTLTWGGTAISLNGHTHTKSQITDFPSLATVATSGSYNDLSNKPTIPSNTNQLTNGAGFITSSGSCNYANSAGNSDTLDSYHEYSFLRYRGTTSTSGEGTLWAQIGIKDYNGALPDGLSDVYQWGEVVSLAGGNGRFEIYCSHNSSNGNGLYYRSGWANDKKEWKRFIDSANIGSQSVNYANSAGSAGSVAWSNVSGRPTALSQFTNDSEFWSPGGGKWNPNANISLTASGSNQEWSFDIRQNGNSGCYWHVWSDVHGSMLRVDADNGAVSVPRNIFYLGSYKVYVG